MTILLANCYPFRPGEVVGPHASSGATLLVCLRGGGRIDLPDGHLILAPGDALLLPPERPRRYGAAERDPFLLVGVHRGPQRCPLRHQEVPPWVPVAGAPSLGERRRDRDGQVAAAAVRAATIFAEADGPSRNRLLDALEAVLEAEWDRLAAGAGEAGRFAALVSWMHLSLGRTISRRELARRAGMAESTFAAAFRSARGESPLRCLTRMRLERARDLLATGDQPIPAIARACGFNDMPWFSRCFRRHCGLTASAWRKRHRRL